MRKGGGSFLECHARLVDAFICAVVGSSAPMAAITSSSSSSGLQNLSRPESVAKAAWNSLEMGVGAGQDIPQPGGGHNPILKALHAPRI